MEYQELQIISELQKMPENNVTNEIIIPLLESLGYYKVEFYGGTDERGKDILCWEYNKFDELKLTVAQVKHFKFTNRSSDSNSFQTVFNQLIQCFTEQLPFSDQTTHIPEEVLLISTYLIDTKTLKTRLSEHLKLFAERVTIIDGLKLATLLKKNKPDLVSKLMGVETEIYSKLESTLNNEILLKSLGYLEKKLIKHIYIDIDFSLGKRTTQLFFNSIFKPKKKTISFENTEWESFKKDCAFLEDEFSLDFLSNTFEKCEETYIDEKKKWDDWNQRNKKKLENKKSISKKDKEDTQDEEKIEPKLSISINGNLLARKISDKRNWIEKKVEEYNKHGNNNELRLFLIRCKKVFDCASIIFFRENRFLSCLFEGKINQHRSSFESTRLKLPIDKIFDTGLNFSVFGEAGAGKTTCLQMYTISKQNDSNRLYIYLPLSRVIQNSYSFNPKDKKYDKYSRLEMGIAKYLSYSGISITFEQFQIFIKSKKITLLLDGIDEAIKKAPWLINEISMLSEKYIDNIQLIVTSRASGPYLDEIPFITITLLPFTDEQKNHFIDSWFGPLKKIVASDIKTHFRRNKALSELVNNPLLTTILCVLAENCLPLPNTEIKLYNDRLDLLTGYYDNVKNISRLITPPDTLKTLAQKLAFYLHSNSKREEDLFELEKISVRLMLNKLRPEASQDALKELIDPCNVLVPMTDDGKFGFGHLRFQEHLAAKEIINNRGIRITPMLNQGWWRSVLLFFANMNDDLHWLIQSLGQENEITSIRKVILLDMINVRPLNERKKLESILKKYLSLEGWNYLDE